MYYFLLLLKSFQIQVQAFNKTMRNNRPGLLPCFLFFQPGHVAVVLRSKSNFLFEQHTKRTEAFKTNFTTNFRYLFVFCQQVFCFFNSFGGEILMRRFFVYLREQAMKMKAGE